MIVKEKLKKKKEANMSTNPIRHNELFFANRAGFQSNVNSSLGSDDFDSIELDHGNGYLPPFMRNMKFALPAEYYLPTARDQNQRYPQKTLVDVFPAPQPLNSNQTVIQPNGYFMAPNPHAFPTIPGCRGGNPVSVQDAMLRGDVTFYS